MAELFKDWLNRIQRFRKQDIGELSEGFFFRDPTRSLKINPFVFYSPADGVLLYQKEVNPGEEIIEVKGRNFTLKNLLMDNDFNQKCLVIGIFLTFLDVHIVRIPTSGNVFYKDLPKIKSSNLPMTFFERDLLNESKIDYKDMKYLFYNSRKLSKVIYPRLDYTYYIVEISDSDVDLSLHLKKNGEFHLQGDRLSVIRYGSQVDLVLPQDTRYQFELLQEEGMHVEAGVDPLVRVIYRGYEDEKTQ